MKTQTEPTKQERLEIPDELREKVFALYTQIKADLSERGVEEAEAQFRAALATTAEVIGPCIIRERGAKQK